MYSGSTFGWNILFLFSDPVSPDDPEHPEHPDLVGELTDFFSNSPLELLI